jgi:glycosyltransferase involved in cell wall biosynthesis
MKGEVPSLRNVLHVRACSGRGGGPERSILPGAGYLRQYGYFEQAAYLYDRCDPGFEHIKEEALRYEIPLHGVADKTGVSPRVLGALAALCRRERVDVWHAHDYKTNLLGLLLRRKLGIRLVTTVHGWVHQTWKTPFYFALDRCCVRRYEQVIAVSKELAQQCLAFGVAADRVSVVDNAFEVRRVRTLSGEELDRTTRAEERAVVIGALGRLAEEKGFDLLIEAVAVLLDEGVDVELRIAGAGGGEADLRARILASGHRERMRLVGFQDDVGRFFAGLDVFALPSRREGMPLALLESMAAGLPAVAARAGGVAEVVEDGVTGLLVPVGDVQALAAALSSLARDPDRRRTLGADARRRAEEHYGFERRARDVAAVYHRLWSDAC